MLNFFKEIKKNIISIIINIKNQFLNIYEETKSIIKEKNDFIIWILLLPILMIVFLIILIIFIFFYLKYFFLFIIKNIKIKIIKKKKKEIIKIKKKKIIINNIYLIFLKNIFIDQINIKSFLMLYSQIEIIKLIKKKEKKNLSVIIEIMLFRFIFIKITNIPFIVIKNNNFIVEEWKKIKKFKNSTLKIKIKTLMYNLILKYNMNLMLKTKKIKIIIKKKEIILNMKEKDLEVLKNLVDIELWVKATNGLANNGVFAKMRYFTYNNKFIPFHPSLYFNNKINNQNLVLNQTTKKNLEVLEKFNKLKNNEYYSEKKKLELKLEINKIFKEGRAYMVMPHLVNEEDIILGDPETLIKNLNKTENIITKFKFIQSFFVYFEFELYKHDPKNGLIREKSYLTIKEYLIKNIDAFGPNTKEGLEKLLEFYEKNEKFLKNNNLSFLELLNKADVNIEIKNYFLKIIENNTK